MERRTEKNQSGVFDLLAIVINVICFVVIAITFVVRHTIRLMLFLSRRFAVFSQMHSPMPASFRMLIRNNKEDRVLRYADAMIRHYSLLLKTHDAVHETVSKYKSSSIAQTENQFVQDKQEMRARYHTEIGLLEHESREEIKKEKAAFEHALNQAADHLNRNKNQLRNHCERESADIMEGLNTMKYQYKSECLTWKDPYWETFSPQENPSRPPLTRIGELEIQGNDRPFTAPALLRIITHKGLLINFGDLKEAALEALRVLVFRLLLTVPPIKVRFLFIDPVCLGSSMSGFMHLPEAIVGQRIWTEPGQIEDELKKLSEHIETVIQKYLKDDFLNIEEYNDQAGEMAEPYRILVAANFPAHFTESATQRLISIARNGPKTGVYSIIMRDVDAKPPVNFDLHKLERLCTVIDQKNSRFIWRDDDFKDHPLSLDRLPVAARMKGLLKIIEQESLSKNSVHVPFSLAYKEKGWSQKSYEGLRIPIGRSSARDLQYLSLGQGTKQHGILAGTTGAGKSNLLHVMIMGMCLRYSPDELALYLIDFKKGIEFKVYAENKLPHARVIAVQSEREFGLSVLQGLDNEMQRRGDIFRKAGSQNLKEFRRKNPETILPRIVLIADEFQEFFTEDDLIATQAALYLDRLARQGRALGINLFLASQTMAGSSTIPRTTIEQMGIRIALRCSEGESRLILGEDNPSAALLSRPGEAYYNDENGRIEANQLFQAFYLTETDLKAHLKSLREPNSTRAAPKGGDVIIFEGDAPSDISTNKTLGALLSRHAAPNRQHSTLSAWLGEPVSIKPPTSADFKRQSMANLMIVGQNEEAATTMLITSLISLAAQRSKDDLHFYIVDLSRPDFQHHDLIREMPSYLPHTIELYEKQAVNEAIERVFEIVKAREETYDEGTCPDIFLFVIALQRAGALRSKDGYTFPEETEQMRYILGNGPDLGVHTVCWGDTIKNIERIIGRDISEFSMRVALQMSVNDSNEVIDSSAANRLGLYKAILYDEEESGDIEKFRPYAMPTREWLEITGTKLRNEQREKIRAKKSETRVLRIINGKSDVKRLTHGQPG